MDLLLNIPTTKISSCNDFDIVVKEIEYGWMALSLGIVNQKYLYEVSYICDPLNDLLESTVLLLTGQPMKNYIYRHWVNLTHCQFDLESEGNLHWVLRKLDNKWYIYLWHNNVYEKELFNLYYSDFDSDKYKKYLAYDFEGFPNLEEGLVFAIEIDPIIWAQILVATFEQLHLKYNSTEYEGMWGVDYNKDNLQILKSSLNKI